MKQPIIENDPITMVAEAFEAVFPGIEYAAVYAPQIRDGNGTIVCSCVTFPDEGVDDVPVIALNSQAGIEVAAEAFAQELAHIALGRESLEHGEEYDKALKAIADKYKEIGSARFPEEVEKNEQKE